MNDSEAIKEEKKKVRKEMKSLIKDYIAAIDVNQAAEKACRKIMENRCYQEAQVILAYLNLPGEISCDRLIEDSLKKGKTTAIPRIRQDSENPYQMDFCILSPLKTISEQTQTGYYGIREPSRDLEILEKEKISSLKILVILPAMAFGKDGRRLGKGKGFYDRYIENMKKTCSSLTLLGLSFKIQQCPQVPFDKYDIKADYLITD